MSDFDVRFRNYENAMHANNNFGLSGQALSDQYGRYAVGLQRDEIKAKNKAQGRAFAKDLARKRALARQDYVNIKFWEQNAQQAQTTTSKPLTWERYAQEHGTAYKKPTNNVGAVDKITEKQIKINNLNKEIVRLQGVVAENPDVQTLINTKQAEVANLQNEVTQIKSGLQTPKVKPAVSTPVTPTEVASSPVAEMPTSRVASAPVAEMQTAEVPSTPADTWATPEEAHSTTKPSRQEVRQDPAKRAKYNKLKLAQNPELAERYESFSRVAKKSAKLKGLKKAGKWGAIAALAVGAGALLLKACSDDKKSETPAENPTPTAPVENPGQGENPTPTAPVENPEQGENSTPVAPVENPDEGAAPASVQPEQLAQPDATENIIQNGDSLEEIANRYGVSVEQLKELNADKIKQFRTADGKVVDSFIVGEDIKLPDGTDKVEGLKGKEATIADYEEYLIENFDKIPQPMWNQVCTPEFRKKHKLGEYKEAV